MNLLLVAFWVGPPVENFSMLLTVNAVASILGVLFGGGLFRESRGL